MKRKKNEEIIGSVNTKEEVILELPTNIKLVDMFLDYYLEDYLSIKNIDIVSVHQNGKGIIVYTDRKNIQKEYIVTYEEIKSYITKINSK